MISIIMGSISDYEVMKQACDLLDKFNVKYEKEVVSAHRTPDKMYKYAKEAKERGIKVIIAGAGGAAHLPGMVSSLTTLPVIGVPIKSKALKGIDSLLSIVQMPKGIVVGTVAINNASNAALLALEILAISNKELSNKLEEHKKEMVDIVNKDHKLK